MGPAFDPRGNLTLLVCKSQTCFSRPSANLTPVAHRRASHLFRVTAAKMSHDNLVRFRPAHAFTDTPRTEQRSLRDTLNEVMQALGPSEDSPSEGDDAGGVPASAPDGSSRPSGALRLQVGPSSVPTRRPSEAVAQSEHPQNPLSGELRSSVIPTAGVAFQLATVFCRQWRSWRTRGASSTSGAFSPRTCHRYQHGGRRYRSGCTTRPRTASPASLASNLLAHGVISRTQHCIAIPTASQRSSCRERCTCSSRRPVRTATTCRCVILGHSCWSAWCRGCAAEQ